MEPNPASAQANSGIKNSLIALLLLVVCTAGLWVYGRVMPIKPLEQSLQSIANVVELQVKLVGGDEQPLENSIFAPVASPAASGAANSSSSSPPMAQESLTVSSRRIALSIYPTDGNRFLAWLSDNPQSTMVLSSPLVQGIFQPLFDTLNITAEDYSLEGVRGQFLRTIFREIVQAESRLDYDPVEGARGLTLSFRRNEAPVTARILPVLLDRVVRRQWNVGGLASPVWEAVVGKQKIFVHEREGLVFLSRSLRGLLNVLQEQASSPASLGSPAESDGTKETLKFVLRADALIDKLLPLIIGPNPSPKHGSLWPIELGLTLDGSTSGEGQLRLPGARVFSLLKPQLEPAVLSSIPGDAFAFFSVSLQLPGGLSAEAWNKIAGGSELSTFPSATGDRGGLSLVWDLNRAADGLSEIGLALSAPLPLQSGDLAITDYARDPNLATTCANGSVWLLSSTPTLLTRMREACDGTSTSINASNRFADLLNGGSQLIAGVQLGAGLGQVFEAGLPNLEPPNVAVKEASWKSDYRATVQTLKQNLEQQLNALPSVFFAGKVDPKNGGSLKGFFR